MCVPVPLRSLMVGWYPPYQLLRPRIAVAISAIFGSYANYHSDPGQKSADTFHLNGLHRRDHGGPVPARPHWLYKRKSTLTIYLGPSARPSR